jgi:hypothetical protein
LSDYPDGSRQGAPATAQFGFDVLSKGDTLIIVFQDQLIPAWRAWRPQQEPARPARDYVYQALEG